MVIDIAFFVLGEDIPTLFSMKDMLQNGLDTSIEEQYVSLGSRLHRRTIKKYFLIHRWTTDDVPYVF